MHFLIIMLNPIYPKHYQLNMNDRSWEIIEIVYILFFLLAFEIQRVLCSYNVSQWKRPQLRSVMATCGRWQLCWVTHL